MPESKDYGRSFTILAADGRNEIYEAEQDGETVNDAIYMREVETEDYLGIELEYVYRTSSWDDKADYMDAINSAVLAGDDAYDLMDVPLSAVLWAVPITASDKQLVADFCEYFSYRSYELVVPAYYESTLKEKYSRDPDTVEMLDLIRQSTRFTCDTAFGYCFSTNPFLTTENLLRSGSNPASYIASNENAWKATLESLLASYQ